MEEVDIVHRGENYGWNVYEGFGDVFQPVPKRRENLHSPGLRLQTEILFSYPASIV